MFKICFKMQNNLIFIGEGGGGYNIKLIWSEKHFHLTEANINFSLTVFCRFSTDWGYHDDDDELMIEYWNSTNVV